MQGTSSFPQLDLRQDSWTLVSFIPAIKHNRVCLNFLQKTLKCASCMDLFKTTHLSKEISINLSHLFPTNALYVRHIFQEYDLFR